MALSDVRPYFRTRLEALNYREHDDGFNLENVPASSIHEKYHIGIGEISGVQNNQDIQTLSTSVVVSVFLRATRDVNAGIDDAMSRLDALFDEILVVDKRLKEAEGIHNVTLTSADISELALSNDNALLLTLNFDVLGFINTRRQ